ncbi:hypothetical protein BOX15_Mlig031196g1 [Macrostomum lignano]|uniref:EF-hand domain-containing protein n=1 Tax=Macrostomum lignano TaxID=282301 RepID=A0A267H6R6_9PLAT|nr:hypothetical protein BOX15_Mlig031196g1 [Macrostomum lignano]
MDGRQNSPRRSQQRSGKSQKFSSRQQPQQQPAAGAAARQKPDKQLLMKWFNDVDTEKRGFITFEGLKAVCKKDGLTESSALEMFEVLDANRDGKITLREYKLLLGIYPEEAREEETWQLIFENIDEEETGQLEFREVDKYFTTTFGQRIALGIRKQDLKKYQQKVGPGSTIFKTEDFIAWLRRERRS